MVTLISIILGYLLLSQLIDKLGRDRRPRRRDDDDDDD